MHNSYYLLKQILVKMKKGKNFRILFISLIVLTNISCDQVAKNIVRKKIEYNEKISYLNNYVILTRVENTGAFLSLGSKIPRPVYLILMIIIPIIAIGYAIYFLINKSNLSGIFVFGLSLIIGGGIGNICDRIKYGSVTDFLHIDFVLFKTGILNIADLSVTFGVFIILYDYYFKNKLLKHKSMED